MKQAEIYMREVDTLLGSAAIFATNSTAFSDTRIDRDARELADMLMCLSDLRALAFHDDGGDLIRLTADKKK